MTIQVVRGDKEELGSCNACNRPELYHTVFEIDLGTMTFRLCGKCADDLMVKLTFGKLGWRK